MPGPAAKFEILLLEEKAANDWWVMLRPGKSAPSGRKSFFMTTPNDTDLRHRREGER